MSVESLKENASGSAFALQPSGRYQHSMTYVRRTLEDAGFSVRKITSCSVREEHGTPVAGSIVIAMVQAGESGAVAER
jgi:predicted TPR repeat methyltransferase